MFSSFKRAWKDALSELQFAWRYSGNKLLVCLFISLEDKCRAMGKGIAHLEVLDRLDRELHLDLLEIAGGLWVERHFAIGALAVKKVWYGQKSQISGSCR